MSTEDETQEVMLPGKGAIVGLAKQPKRPGCLDKIVRKRYQGHKANRKSEEPGLESRLPKFQSNIPLRSSRRLSVTSIHPSFHPLIDPLVTESF